MASAVKALPKYVRYGSDKGMKYAALSDRGLVRKENQDDYLALDYLVAVADGMGGHEAGGLASQTALEAITKTLSTATRKPKTALRSAFILANSSVRQKALETQHTGMGTTLTVVYLKNFQAWIGHVGDSRAYLLHEGRLSQLTNDHSLVGDLLRSGSLTTEEARDHPKRHIITKAVGNTAEIKPDLLAIKLKLHDRLILCTDGLTNHVDTVSLAKLASNDNLETACRNLVDAAKNSGGSDNITVVIADIGNGTKSSPASKSFWQTLIANFQQHPERAR